MSSIAATNLVDRASSDSVPVADVQAGYAKAWVKFNGTGTVAIDDSFNITSVTDVGTGIYEPQFTAAMPNANFAVGATVQTSGVHNDIGIDCQAHTTAKYRIRTLTSGGIFYDCTNFSSIVCCNLA